jgi:putative DNA primase/helicase
MQFNPDGIPDKMKGYTQWVVWRLEDKQGEKKSTKIPYNPQVITEKASSIDNKTWGTFDKAVEIYKTGLFSGVGFVFTNDDPFIGIDFDHCIIDGKINNCAFLNTRLFGSYTEISQSGTGLHVIGEGYNPDKTNTGHKKGDLEFYTNGRYFALTGNVWKKYNDITTIPQTILQPFYKKYFGELPTQVVIKKTPMQKLTKGKELTDDRIIELCSNAKNSSKFASLWRGNITGYNSHSEADLALTSILSFYTQDHNQLSRMLNSSGLSREKMNREDYTNRTIEKATSGMKETFGKETGVCYFCKKPIGKTNVGEYHPHCGHMRMY